MSDTHRRRTRTGLRALGSVAVTALAILGPAATAVPASAAPAASARHDAVKDPVSYVNPLIGSSHAGNTYPGAVQPFGMLAWSPQNSRGKQVSTPAPGGYQYDATKIRGFSLTHLNGVGCSGANGDIPIMPYAGDVDSSPSSDTTDATYASTFSHANETASPGYYRVGLDNGTSAALTTTARTGTGQFGFPAGKPATMLFRTSNSESGSAAATVKVDAARRTVTGSVSAGNFCGPQSANNRKDLYTLYFTAHFDKAFAKVGTWTDGTVKPGSTSASGGTGYSSSGNATEGKGSGAYVTFAGGTTKARAKVAISYVSPQNAEANLRAENGPGKSFDSVKSQAARAWQRELTKIGVSGGTEAQRTTFYTALYHSMLEPTLTSDVDGRYLGADRKPHELAKGQQAQYGTFSGWDQYRAQVQLMTLLNAKAGSDYAQSLYNYAGQRGGEWDRWLLENGKTSVMSGDPSDAALAGIYAFGGRDFDVKGALKSLVGAATVPTANDSDSSGCNVECVGQRPALDQYLKLGYVPADNCHCWGGAAETLEDAAADFGLSELSRQTGHPADAKKFLDRSGNWTNVFDANATEQGGYIRDRKADGSWAGTFTPATGSGFVEGSSARYTWMVYSDVAGLASAMGGKETAVQRLDSFFRAPDGTFDFSAKDDTRYDATNEPDINAPYLYDYLGVPYKTQETVRAELDQLWTDGPGGIPGNDDAGTMSSWYVFSALGMYPQIPSRADLTLSAPLFPKAVVHTGHGRTITVNAPAASAGNAYIQGLEVNGKKSGKPWVPASFVTEGGTLDYALGSRPNTSWGSAAADAPPSFPGGGVKYFTGASPDQLKVEPGAGGADTTVKVQTLDTEAARVHWTATPPPGVTVTPASGDFTVPAGGSASAKLSVSAAADTAEGHYTVPVTLKSSTGADLPKTSVAVTVAEKNGLLWNRNNTAISADDDNPQANFDGEGWSYSAKALAAAGATPGSTVSANGFDFSWPKVTAGDPDNIEVAGSTPQVLTVPPAPGATELSLLGSAAEGSASGTLTLTYADGTTQQADIGFSDWTLGGGSDKPSFGNTIAVHTDYRDVQGGGQDPIGTEVFATAPIALQAGKQLASVTMPSSTKGGVIHVFAVATA
ncbi:GH92 family glycosyl hydrolase [Streptomyces sp. NBC_01267]|uniref:GH92 family glycosyl hydrolase n=1 Tax=unclassified Streptomyces TaxID=2593676 RepID=UPI002DDC4EB6|nr:MULTISPECIES: GH92 family glycosyl hydrolase [unclassified Streptomyces]WSC22895.1 GH92 family glycosyl hydrolase [Streptomyces sp. NBC_01766]